LETAGVDVGHGDVLEELQAASVELSRFRTVPEVADAALTLALELTNSAVAFMALFEENGEDRRVFCRVADPSNVYPPDVLERIFSSAQTGAGAGAISWSSAAAPASRAIKSSFAQTLEAGGRPLGLLGVASPAEHSASQQRTLAIFARHVAAAVAMAQLHERREEMVDTLVNLRADLDLSERERLVNEERARSAERVERAHEAAVDALLAVSRHARTGHGLTDFYRRLTRTIAELVGAEMVLFWKLEEGGLLRPVRGAHGIDDELVNRLDPTPCAPDREDVASRIVFHDLMFRAAPTDPSRDFQHVLKPLDVDDAIAVPWRAGDERLGVVAAYNSGRSEGFSREDTWVLQKAGLAAGLVWQLRHAETDLRKTVERLHKVDAARRLLLKNVSTAMDSTRKRFAGDLHDEALQKLTAAELQLQRLHEPNGDSSELLADAEALLAQTEEALRRLLFEVRPPTLEVPGGFAETIHERIQMLRSLSGAVVDTDIELPDDLSYEYRSMLFRQLTEAIANVEKHSAATRVQIALKVQDAGIHGRVEDNGRGFIVAEREQLPGHLGLLGLNERALLAGGWNRIKSEPGQGTTVEFWLPFSEAKV
jgi:signal transduction histidine kinase